MTRKEFEELVGIAIGEASMCWSETPKGIFDSDRASKIVDRIVDAYPLNNEELDECFREASKKLGW